MLLLSLLAIPFLLFTVFMDVRSGNLFGALIALATGLLVVNVDAGILDGSIKF
jgi:hypothetical protein